MSTARKGKVARLPTQIRDQVNLRLRDNVAYPKIIEFLDDNGCRGFNEMNISNWRNGGYKEWETKQLWIEKMRNAHKILTGNKGPKSEEENFSLAASLLFHLLTEVNVAHLGDNLGSKPDTYLKAVNCLARLSEAALDAQKLRHLIAQQKTLMPFLLGLNRSKSD